MEPQAAGELVHTWVQAHHDPVAVGRQRGPVSRAVRALVPDGKLAGVAGTSRGPAMAVLLDPALLLLDAQAAPDGEAAPIRALLVQLDPPGCELEVIERFEERRELGMTRVVRVRRWQLRAPAATLELEGCEVVQGGSPAELGRPDDNEALGRAVAARLGWTLP